MCVRKCCLTVFCKMGQATHTCRLTRAHVCWSPTPHYTIAHSASPCHGESPIMCASSCMASGSSCSDLLFTRAIQQQTQTKIVKRLRVTPGPQTRQYSSHEQVKIRLWYSNAHQSQVDIGCCFAELILTEPLYLAREKKDEIHMTQQNIR